MKVDNIKPHVDLFVFSRSSRRVRVGFRPTSKLWSFEMSLRLFSFTKQVLVQLDLLRVLEGNYNLGNYCLDVAHVHDHSPLSVSSSMTTSASQILSNIGPKLVDHFDVPDKRHPRAACESEVVSLGDLLSRQMCRQSEVVVAKTGVEESLFVFSVAHVLIEVVFPPEPGAGTALFVQVWEGKQGSQY